MLHVVAAGAAGVVGTVAWVSAGERGWARESAVERGGARWSAVERGGARWSAVERGGRAVGG